MRGSLAFHRPGRSWKDCSYESIDKRDTMTRAYWLACSTLDNDKKMSAQTAATLAWRQVEEEDRQRPPDLELSA